MKRIGLGLGLVAVAVLLGQDVDPVPAPELVTEVRTTVPEVEIVFTGKVIRDGNTWKLVSLVAESRSETTTTRNGAQVGDKTTVVSIRADILSDLQANVGKTNVSGQLLRPGVSKNATTGKLAFQEATAPTAFLRALKATMPSQ